MTVEERLALLSAEVEKAETLRARLTEQIESMRSGLLAAAIPAMEQALLQSDEQLTHCAAKKRSLQMALAEDDEAEAALQEAVQRRRLSSAALTAAWRTADLR